MNEIFSAMLRKSPDEIINGDYYYRIQWLEEEQKKYHTWIETADELSRQEEYSKKHFIHNWNQRSFTGEFDAGNDAIWLKDIKGKTENSHIYRIFREVADSGMPVMDLCSSENMGLLPYLLKLNPNIPCLAQDVNVHELHRLRRRLNENLSSLNVNLISFDNLEMPLKDNTVPCITGSGAITHCAMNRNFEYKPELTLEENKIAFHNFTEHLELQAIREIYRVLKNGGLFILYDGGEILWEYDYKEINEFFESNALLYSLYSRETIISRLKKCEEDQTKTMSLENKLLTAGFEVIESKQCKWQIPITETARQFSETGDPVDLPQAIPGEKIIRCYGKTGLYILRK